MSASELFSPIAPARIRALVLPAGRIKKRRFSSFLEVLRSNSHVRLGDVTPDPRPDRVMFSPLQSPNTTVFYDFDSHAPSDSHMALSPFELFREPFVVIGLVDAEELGLQSSSNQEGESSTGIASKILDVLSSTLDQLREQYSRSLVHKLIIFNTPSHLDSNLPEHMLSAPAIQNLKSTTMKTLVGDLTSALLAEMTSSVKAIQGLPSIPSPTSPSPSTTTNGASGADPRGLANGRARSASPSVHIDKSAHRMSMPVLTTTTSAPNPRPDSPDVGARSNTSKASGEATGTGKSRPASVVRTNSENRISVQGFGSGGQDEWNRNRGRARIGIVIGSLHMQAGRWADAIKQLAEHAVKAKEFGDHIWHAKALENILVCMLLLAWARIPYRIPSLCYPLPERPNSSKSAKAEIRKISSDGPEKPPASAEDLQKVIPDLIFMILAMYHRPPSNTGEALPELAFAESSVRLARIMTALNKVGGTLNVNVLQHIVSNTPLKTTAELSSSRFSVAPSRSSISNLLLRALPEDQEHSQLTPIDRLNILGGIASVYSDLGLQRKRSLLIKTYLEALIVALTNSQIEGAAAAGLHPSANLSALSLGRDESEASRRAALGAEAADHGLEDFLNVLCQIHGIPESKWSTSIGHETLHPRPPSEACEDKAPDSHIASPGPLPEQLVGNFVLRAFGNVQVKAEVLRICIRLCDLLPDLPGMLHYATALLRSAGPGIALSQDNNDAVVSLSRDEQVHLSRSIVKTVAEAGLLGNNDVQAEFWDEFLIRGLYVLEAPPSMHLHPRKRRLLEAAQSRQTSKQTSIAKGPFLYSAFAKAEEKDTSNLLVLGEAREFVVALQNPYEFDLEIESLKAIAGGEAIASSSQGFTLRPMRTQSVSITGIPRVGGQTQVDGCLVKVKACRERLFPIFVDPWTPERETRVKNVGVIKKNIPESRPVSDASASENRQSRPVLSKFPLPAIIPLNILPEQPVLISSSISIAQDALMVLEGETRSFTITLRNISNVIANLVLVVCTDSHTSAISEATRTKGLLPADLFAYEEELAAPALTPDSHEVGRKVIEPGQTVPFRFKITGKPGLVGATVNFDYANTGTAGEQHGDTIYTRQLSVPLAVTVNASAQIRNWDIIALSSAFSTTLSGMANAESQSQKPIEATTINPEILFRNRMTDSPLPNDSLAPNVGTASRGRVTFTSSAYSLLVADIRNAWPTPLQITVGCRVPSQWMPADGQDELREWHEHMTIQPGHVERVVLPIPRLYLEHSVMSIQRALRSANERQFVVSTIGNISPDMERVQRELFWHRTMLARLLTATWQTQEGSRKGSLSFNTLQLNSRMLESLRENDIGLEMWIRKHQGQVETTQISGSSSIYKITVEEPVTLQIRVFNRSSHRTIWPHLRLTPSLAHNQQQHPLQTTQASGPDLTKLLTWSGAQQRPIRALAPGTEATVALSLCALCSGTYEISATVDEMKKCNDDINEKQKRGEWQDGLHGPVMDAIASGQGRRSWTFRQACIIEAVR